MPAVRAKRRPQWWWAVLLVGAACTPVDVVLLPPLVEATDGGATPVAVPGLRALRIEPPTAGVLVDDGLAPGETATFQAIGTFDDGERNVTDEVGWRVGDVRLGSIAAGLFTSAGVGGSTFVEARAGAIVATAELEIRLEAIEVVGQAPPNAASFFPDDTSEDRSGPDAPFIVYPADETLFPRNFGAVFQWTADSALDLFEVSLDSERAHARIYTTERSWAPTSRALSWLGPTHAGASLNVRVRGIAQRSPNVRHGSSPITLHYSEVELTHEIFYQSRSRDRLLRASLDGDSAEVFLPIPGGPDSARTIENPTLSADGRRLAFAWDEKLRVFDAEDRSLLVDRIEEEPGEIEEPSFDSGAFNPGATRLAFAHEGDLEIIDVAAARRLQKWERSGVHAAQPSWAPDGRHLAVALVEGGLRPTRTDVVGSSLARLPLGDDGRLGAPDILVRGSTITPTTMCFPAYSPDGRWIAYVEAPGNARNNPDAEVWIVRADGSQAPKRLDRLNRQLGADPNGSSLASSTPTWIPSETPGVQWLAFSSSRPYGFLLPGGDARRERLWISALDLEDPTRADPSFGAFYLTFQDPDGRNRSALARACALSGCR